MWPMHSFYKYFTNSTNVSLKGERSFSTISHLSDPHRMISPNPVMLCFRNVLLLRARDFTSTLGLREPSCGWYMRQPHLMNLSRTNIDGNCLLSDIVSIALTWLISWTRCTQRHLCAILAMRCRRATFLIFRSPASPRTQQTSKSPAAT
jgi:hypothetical protein